VRAVVSACLVAVAATLNTPFVSGQEAFALSVTSEGVVSHAAAQAGAVGTDRRIGAGIVVGFIAPAVNPAALQLLVDAGQLPSSNEGVGVLEALPGSFDAASTNVNLLDGLQVIYDLAPGATLAIATPPSSIDADACVDWVANLVTGEPIECAIRALQALDVDVIIDAFGPLPSEAALYEDATTRYIASVADTVPYIVAAGDEGQLAVDGSPVSPLVYEASFNAGQLPNSIAALLATDFSWVESAHVFAGSDRLLRVARNLAEVCVSWADNPEESVNDYELFVFADGENGQEIIASSVNFQYGEMNQEPRECVQDLPAGANILIGTDAIASEGRYLRVSSVLPDGESSAVNGDVVGAFEYTSGGSLKGRAGLINVLTIGGAPFSKDVDGDPRAFETGDPVSDTTTVGPRAVFFDYDSVNGYTPVDSMLLNAALGDSIVRIKPDLAGSDGINVLRVNLQDSTVSPALAFGSVVASAHVGAMSALMLEGVTNPTPARVREAFLGSAEGAMHSPVDVGATGPDAVAGYGAPLFEPTFTEYLRLDSIAMSPLEVALAFARGSGQLSWVPSQYDNGNLLYSVACLEYDPASEQAPLAAPQDYIPVEGQKYSFVVTPGMSAACYLSATANGQAANAAAAELVGTDIAGDLQTPTLLGATPDIYAFNIAFNLDPQALPSAYVNSELQCRAGGAAVIDRKVGGRSPVVQNVNEIVEYTCDLYLLAFNDTPEAMTSTGSVLFSDIVVTPEELPAGLPIWLMTEAAPVSSNP